ncbi:MAG: AraC family transcriptional regulator [Deltaproteobacteria bacterium]|nr:AraC family transcriptional regulator [Deltaproteobacteria bacterium]
MLYQEHPPHPGLKNYIKCYWTLSIPESGSPHEGQYFLAEGLEFSFNLADPIEFAAHAPESATVRRSCIWGPMTQPMRIKPTNRVEIFGVCFRPGGAYPFFFCPAAELVNASAGIDDLWGAPGLGLVDGIQYGCRTTRDRMDLLDRHFLHRLEQNRRQDAGLAAALDIVDAHKGQVSIDHLARLAGLSRRQLERCFKERVGMSPKQLCRSLRFKNVFKHLATFTADSWVSTALACGYYDQSHMIRDFKHYTGTSPAAFFTRPGAGEQFFTGNF